MTERGDEVLRSGRDPRAVVVELCRRFHAAGWASGTGGGVSVRQADRLYVAPSGVQKELLAADDLFVLDLDGFVVERPRDEALRLSACAPLFLHAFRMRDAGAVIHSHSPAAVLATLACGSELRLTHLEMIKGIDGHGYHDELVVPVLDNVAHECDLADALADAIRAYPRTSAVLVRRHGVYVWGPTWARAKTHAECYDYLFDTYVRMRAMGLDPSVAPPHGGGR